jgi:serine/threonine protein kinase
LRTGPAGRLASAGGEGRKFCAPECTVLPLSALNFAKQLLVALQFAHEHGVMHRDVTPSNIMIAPDGAVKLTDFGLAKAPRDMRLTQSGAVIGSLYYMSPEQVRGSATLDERAVAHTL